MHKFSSIQVNVKFPDRLESGASIVTVSVALWPGFARTRIAFIRSYFPGIQDIGYNSYMTCAIGI